MFNGAPPTIAYTRYRFHLIPPFSGTLAFSNFDKHWRMPMDRPGQLRVTVRFDGTGALRRREQLQLGEVCDSIITRRGKTTDKCNARVIFFISYFYIHASPETSGAEIMNIDIPWGRRA